MKYIIMICTSMLLASCIEWGLDELENLSGTDLVNMRFEHRFVFQQQHAEPNAAPIEQLAVVPLPTSVTREGNHLVCQITVPAVGSPGYFTEEEREKVSLSSIVGVATISTAATIIPIGDAPVLGKLGDFSGTHRYLVKAADGVNTEEYTITCVLIK